MANLLFDFTSEDILHPSGHENISFTYKDIGTENFKYAVDAITGKETASDLNSSNIDANAIKSSLTNILTFRER